MKSSSWQSISFAKVLRVFFTIALVSFWTACADDSENLGPDPDAASKGGTNTGGYVISNSSDGLVWTINVSTPKGTKDASHFLLQFQDCDGNFVSGSYVQSVTINGVNWPILYSTGTGTGCSVGNSQPFIKLEGISGKIFEIVVTLNKAALSGSIVVKSGTTCGSPTALTSTYVCSTDVCSTETAWAAGSRYVMPGNWATYTAYSGANTVTLWAGQFNEAGTVSFSAPVAGMVTISVSFNEGWGLNPIYSEGVKIQGYATAPSGNPSPGLFTTYKGNLLTVTVPQFNFYGVHLDVAYSSAECPE